MADNSIRWPGRDGAPGVDFGEPDGGETVMLDDTEKAQAHQGPAQPANPKQAPGPATAPAGAVPPPAPTNSPFAKPDAAQGAPSAKANEPVTSGPANTAGVGKTGPGAPVGKPADSVASGSPAAKQAVSDATAPMSAVAGKPSAPSKANPTTAKTGDTKSKSADEESTTVLASPAAAPVFRSEADSKPMAVPSAAGQSAPTSRPSPATRSGAEPAPGPNRRTRKARLRLARIDPWSVMKTTFLFSIAFGVMLLVIAFVLWTVIVGSGALEAVDSVLTQLIGDSENTFRVGDYINVSRVMGFTALIAAIDVVIITAVSTLFAFLYNLASTVLGGLEITLAED